MRPFHSTKWKQNSSPISPPLSPLRRIAPSRFAPQHQSVAAALTKLTVWRLKGTDGARYFLKLNEARHHPIPSTWLRTGFAAEAQWLNAIAATNTLRVPRPVAHGISNSHSFLILEYLELGSR